MNASPDLSIITVNYNGFQDTCELASSLRKHIRSCSYELIVVDNGSRENEAKRLQEIFPEILAIRSEKNLGFAGGNNLGIRQATGKYILLLNNDTYVADDSLHFLCEALESSSEIGAVGPKIKFAFAPQNIQCTGYTPLSKYTLRNRSIGFDEPDWGQYNTPRPTAFLHGAAMMLKREVIEKAGYMPEIFFLYYEEMDWCNRIRQQGYQLWYEPRCIIYHKESSTTGQDSPMKTYYLTRNRLLYAYRNRNGMTRLISLLYQLGMANPKNIIVNLLKGKIQQAKAICTGCTNFFSIKNKRL